MIVDAFERFLALRERHWAIEEKQLVQLIDPLAVFAGAFLIFLAIRWIVLHSVKRHASGPQSAPAVFAKAVRVPSILWSLAGALKFAIDVTDLTPAQDHWVSVWIGAFIIISLTLFAASIAVRMIVLYGERQGMSFAVAGLPRAVARVIVLVLGGTALLANFGVHVTALLTTLGVGGIAVALALQDTLANFFAGIHIVVEKPIFVGDTIRLEGGQEGVVSDIGWRTTRVRTGTNDMVVVPNTKITSGILLNYSIPDKRTVATIPILTAHEADAELVCRIALEEARAIDGVLAEPAPACLCDPGVLATHIEFRLFVNIADRTQSGRIQSDIRMRLLTRFRELGVPLPNPELTAAVKARS